MAGMGSSSVIYIKDVLENKDAFQRFVSLRAVNGVKLFINSNDGLYLGVSPRQKRKINERVKIEDVKYFGISENGYFQADFDENNFLNAINMLRRLPYNYSIEYDMNSRLFLLGNYLDSELYMSVVKWRFLLSDLESLGFNCNNSLAGKYYPGKREMGILSGTLLSDMKVVLNSIMKYGNKRFSDVTIHKGTIYVGDVSNALSLSDRDFDLVCKSKLLCSSKLKPFIRPIRKGLYEISKVVFIKDEYLSYLINILVKGEGSVSIHWDMANGRWLLVVDTKRFYNTLESFIYFMPDTRCRVVEKF